MTSAVAEKLKKVQELIAQQKIAPSTACKKIGLGWPYYLKYTGKKIKRVRAKKYTGTLTALPKTTQTPYILFVGSRSDLVKVAREFTQ